MPALVLVSVLQHFVYNANMDIFINDFFSECAFCSTEMHMDHQLYVPEEIHDGQNDNFVHSCIVKP